MFYLNHFQHADEVIGHLNGVVPSISDATLRGKYVGFIAVASVTVYELAIRDIFIEFSRKKHRVFGHYIESEFRRINGRIRLSDIKSRYLKKFGDRYLNRFQRKVDEKSRYYLKESHRDFPSAYGNIIVWRNEFAHEGRINSTATYQEAVQSYEDGKEVIHCLASSMHR